MIKKLVKSQVINEAAIHFTAIKSERGAVETPPHLLLVNIQKEEPISYRLNQEGDLVLLHSGVLLPEQIHLDGDVVCAEEESNNRKHQEDRPFSVRESFVHEQIGQQDDRSCDSREQERCGIDHIVQGAGICYDGPAGGFTWSIANFEDNEQEYAEYERGDVGDYDVAKDEMHQIEILSRSQGFPINQTCDENYPEISSHREGYSSNQAAGAQPIILGVDVAHHLEQRLHHFIDQQDGEDLKDHQAPESPPHHIQTHKHHQEHRHCS